MKTMRFKLLLFLLILPGLAMAGDIKKGKYTKEKKIHKAYIVQPTAALQIANKFGNVYVTTWDEDKTDIDIVITVSGNNEEKVNKRLESIDVAIEAFTTRVSAVTKIGGGSYNNISMEINYTIKIPKKGSIDINNQYGGITTGIINGKAEIHCEYGRINLDQLNNVENNIKLQYSPNGNINYVNKANIYAEYSDFLLKKANNIWLKSAYTHSNFNDLGEINLNGEYGSFKVKNIEKLTGKCDYLNPTIGTVRSSLNISLNYGNIQIDNITAGTKNVTINSSYGQVDVNTASDYSFDFEFSLEYGALNGGSGLTFTEKKEKDFDIYYKGYYRKSGVNKMFIKAEYGNIKLGRN